MHGPLASMYIKIRVFCTKFVNKYYSNYDSLQRTWTWPPVMASPSGRVPEQAPERFLVATEAYGGGTPDLSSVLMFLGYVGLYRRKKSVGGASRGPLEGRARPLSRGLLDALLTWTPSLPDHILPKNHTPKGFIPFGLRLIFLFFEILKQAIKQQYGLGLRLIG